MMKIKHWVFILGSLLPIKSFAVICSNADGSVQEVFYDLSSSFNTTNNRPGAVVQLQKEFSNQVYAKCPVHKGNNTTKRSYITDLPVVDVTDGYKYLELNEYLWGAMRIKDSYAGIFYPPANYIQMGMHPNVGTGGKFAVTDSNFIFSLKVVRPFIDMVVIPKKTMFTVYVTTESGESLSSPVYTISYSGIINVPQSCQIDAGQTVKIEFGRIGAQLFSQAGAGNIPNNINPISKQIAIKCKNIDAQALLSLRIETEKVNGSILVSDNPDVGFKIGDKDRNVLIPNTFGSKIPFKLDDNSSSNVTITAWPVSVTGNKPKEGVFQARGYIRVDFD